MAELYPQGVFFGLLINVSSRSIARLFRLLLLVVISTKFGVGYVTDAYFITQSLLLFFLFMGEGVLNYSFIPIFIAYKKNDKNADAWQIANISFTLPAGFFLLITVVIYFSAPGLVRGLAPGFSRETLDLTTLLIRLISPIPFFAGLSSIPTAVFISHRSFTTPAITSVFYGGCAILATLALADTIGIRSVVVGSVIGVGLQTIVLLFRLKMKCREFGLSFSFHFGIRQIARLSGPRMVGYALSKVNFIIDKIFASRLGLGNVSYLTYAYRLFQIPTALFVSALAGTLMPVFSEYAASSQTKEIQKNLSKIIRLILFITIPGAVILIIHRLPIIQILFERGAFDTQSTQFTATAFFFYLTGLVFVCMNIILLSVFYAIQDINIPLKIILLNFILNIVLDLILIPLLGLGGIALASSIIAVLNTVLFLLVLQKRFGEIITVETYRAIGKMLFASGLMGLGLFYTNLDSMHYFLPKNRLISMGISTLAGLLFYCFICILIQVKEFGWMCRHFRIVSILPKRKA